MKKFLVAMAVLMATAALISACSSGGGGGGTTAVTTSEQGAQTAKSASLATGNVLNGAMGVSGQVGEGLGGPGAPKFEQTRGGKRLTDRISKRIMPAVKKARAMAKAVSMKKATTTYDLDADYGYCSDGGQASLSIDDTSYVITFSFTNCRDFGYEETGNWRLACSNADCTGLSMTITDTWTEYDQTGYTGTYLYTDKLWEEKANETISYTMNSATKETMSESGTGSFEEFGVSPLYSGDFSIGMTYSFEDTSTAAQWAFVAVANGSFSWTEYKDNVKDYAEAASFGNLTVEFTMDTTTYDYTEAIDGSYTITLYPADACVNGTYVFKTVTPITVDWSTGMTTAGEIWINNVVVVTYNADGSVTVSIDGGKTTQDISEVDWDALCAEAESKSESVDPNQLSAM